jgi:gamma-glutamylcyclotransferase (GGCT)/AIG2-like uncharacterized protein YtfP
VAVDFGMMRRLSMNSENLPIFVYGTLKRGEERDPLWPRRPRLVQWATTRGRLYDLGPYPALVAGDDLVLGELWHVEPEVLELTLKALDRIECYGIDDVDLYVRRVVFCQTLQGQTHRAHTYLFAHPDEITHAPVLPDNAGLCHWSGHSQRRSKSDTPWQPL